MTGPVPGPLRRTPAGRVTRIELFSLASPQMRAFHMSWLAFFSVFFAWFGVAPLMPVVREDLGLTTAQVGNTIIASVGATIFARILIGPLCDRFGARRTYSALLVIGSIPVMTIGLASSYPSFLLFRLAIGTIGAAFVITQYHTSVMFAPNCVGTANATTAGWGNLGGGVTQMVMPLVFAAFLMLGASEPIGWRLAMTVPGIVLFVLGIAYYLFTQDTPEGSHRRPARRAVKHPSPVSHLPSPLSRISLNSQQREEGGGRRETGDGCAADPTSAAGSFFEVARDSRVWTLVVVYAACFGVELTINNVAALYYYDRFGVDLKTAGLLAGLFGLMNLFARTLGGYVSDRWARRYGLSGRKWLLFCVLLAEGLALIVFSRISILAAAIVAMLIFSLFVQMTEGATYGVVPFVNRRALGAVAGIVGAGGNAGAVAAAFLFRSDTISFPQAFLYLGAVVAVVSLVVIQLRFDPAAERAAQSEVALAGGAPVPVGTAEEWALAPATLSRGNPVALPHATSSRGDPVAEA